MNPWVDEYMGSRLDLIEGIDDNLRERIALTLLEGAEAGETIPELARRVREVFGEAIDYRSELIARTETVVAYGRASIAAYRDAGIAQAVMYDGLNDDGADCLGVNGMEVSLADADRLMMEEHPMGTRGVAPLVPGADLLELGLRRPPARKAYAPETRPRDPEHLHEYGKNERPVLSFDFHGTLTPDEGFPLTHSPFPGLGAFVRLMVSRGCCLHLASSSFDTGDGDLRKARIHQAQAWCRSSGIPISLFIPNAAANARLDDRGVHIPADPDWDAIGAEAQERLLAWYELVDGLYVRRTDLVPVGDPVASFPRLADVPPDRPRGFTTPILDIDVCRTIRPAWGTGRTAPPDPAGVAVIRRLYDAGYQIQPSCAGWSPALESDGKADERRAVNAQYLAANDIPYDRQVSKDDCDLWFDNRTVAFTGDWPAAAAALVAIAGPPNPK